MVYWVRELGRSLHLRYPETSKLCSTPQSPTLCPAVFERAAIAGSASICLFATKRCLRLQGISRLRLVRLPAHPAEAEVRCLWERLVTAAAVLGVRLIRSVINYCLRSNTTCITPQSSCYIQIEETNESCAQVYIEAHLDSPGSV